MGRPPWVSPDHWTILVALADTTEVTDGYVVMTESDTTLASPHTVAYY